MATHYTNLYEYLNDEFSILDARLRSLVESLHRVRQDDHPLQELYISGMEIQALLRSQPSYDKPDEYYDFIKEQMEMINERVAETQRAGGFLPLLHLQGIFSLTRLEVEIIIVALAPFINSKYSRIYAYLNIDITKTDPTIELAMSLLHSQENTRDDVWRCFTGSKALGRMRLLHFEEIPRSFQTAFTLDEHIADYLVGSKQLDPSIARFTSIHTRSSIPPEMFLLSDTKDRVKRMVASRLDQEGEIIVYIYGERGVGRKTLAQAVCEEIGLPLLIADIEGVSYKDGRMEETLIHIFREAYLNGAVVYIDNYTHHTDDSPDRGTISVDALRILDEFTWITFIAGREPWERPPFEASKYLAIEIPKPTFTMRREIWRQVLGDEGLSEEAMSELASKFIFTPGQIMDTVTTARTYSLLRGGADARIALDDLYRGARLQSSIGLRKLARKIDPIFTWDDIILPTDKKRQLREIVNHVRHKYKVYRDWGFEKKIARSKGLDILFSGESGTGKTMAAEIMANELKIDMYKVDLSTVVSKYVGETEKNLDKIFKEAETSNAILFFDEADALFGKRSEVKDAHDRYANIEIGYLLQRMEDYEGIVILASNMPKNIDEAFVRRMHFWVEFPSPDVDSRLKIWRRMFPDEVKRSKDVNLKFMAEQFIISGGNIKNIVVAAAFLAAEDSDQIEMRHMIKATVREYQKMGRPVGRSEFGKYLELVTDS